MVLKLESNVLASTNGATCRKGSTRKVAAKLYVWDFPCSKGSMEFGYSNTEHTCFSQINEQLGNWQLVEFIGHLKLLEKNNISSTNVHQEHLLLPNHLAR